MDSQPGINKSSSDARRGAKQTTKYDHEQTIFEFDAKVLREENEAKA